jgi:hypothetical protein
VTSRRDSQHSPGNAVPTALGVMPDYPQVIVKEVMV